MNHALLFRKSGCIGYAREHREAHSMVTVPSEQSGRDLVRSFLIRIFTRSPNHRRRVVLSIISFNGSLFPQPRPITGF